MSEVHCEICDVRVEVERWSEFHRTVQWPSQSDACPRLAQCLGGVGDLEHQLRTDHSCPALRGSIDKAIDDGRIPLSDRSDETALLG